MKHAVQTLQSECPHTIICLTLATRQAISNSPAAFVTVVGDCWSEWVIMFPAFLWKKSCVLIYSKVTAMLRMMVDYLKWSIQPHTLQQTCLLDVIALTLLLPFYGPCRSTLLPLATNKLILYLRATYSPRGLRLIGDRMTRSGWWINQGKMK